MKAISVSWLILWTMATASAAPSAERLFADGRVLVAQGKYVEACEAFERSYAAEPAIGTRLNVADCMERRAKPAAAWQLWISSAEALEVTGDATKAARAQFARNRADALAPLLATIVVRMAIGEARVFINGRPIAVAPEMTQRLDPGSFEVVVEAPGRRFSTTVVVGMGAQTVVVVPLLLPLDPPVEQIEVAATPVPVASPRSDRVWRRVAIAGGSVTVVATATLVFANRKLAGLERSRPPGLEVPTAEELRQAKTAARYSTLSYASGIAGGLALTATAIALVEIVRGKQELRSVAVAPLVAPSTAGAAVSLRW